MSESEIPQGSEPVEADAVASDAVAAWTAPPVPGENSETVALDAPDVPDVPATTEPRKSKGVGVVVAASLAAIVFGGAAGFGGGYLGANLGNSPVGQSPSGTGVVTVNNPGSVNETTAIATKVLPSVVTIDVESSTSSGSGSGVVLTADGYILSNAHVVTLSGEVSNAQIRVMTSDGRLFDASVVGVDTIYDLAVIKVEATDLIPIEFADSSSMNVGDTAVALGAPLGYANSVTTGIISALDRSISIRSSAPSEEEEDDDSFQFRLPGQQQGTGSANPRIWITVIQTDAAINPGNSGGALVNSAGRLIGINVAIATTGSESVSGSIGLGFAIPSNIAKRVATELIETGEATHGLLGATVQPSTSVEGAQVAGAYVSEVSAGGAAELAGLMAGDIITHFNGSPITSAIDLTAQVRGAAAGSVASITYVRDGLSYTVQATLGRLVL